MLTSSHSHIVLSSPIRAPSGEHRALENNAPTSDAYENKPIVVGSTRNESIFNPTSRRDLTSGRVEDQRDVSGERVTQFKEDSIIIGQQQV